jgi:Tol biopolymer transport system component
MARTRNPEKEKPMHSRIQFQTICAVAVLALGALALLATPEAASAKKPPKPPPEPADPAIAFIHIDPGTQCDILVMDDDGGNEAMVLENVPGFRIKVAWSPDSTQLVFSGEVDGPGIYRVDVDGTDTVKITSHLSEFFIGIPAWSPVPCADGYEWIAFEDRNQGSIDDHEIHLVRPDGSERFQLTDTLGITEREWAWSPTATRLAVIRDEWVGGEESVWIDVMNLGVDEGGSLYVVSTSCITCDPSHPLHNADMWEIDWARTQDVLAVPAAPVGGPSGKKDIWLIDLLDPGNPTQVTQTPDNGERFLSWSPDDSKFVYKRGSESRRENGIYTINVDGTGLRMIKKGINDTYPDWRRD